MFLGSVLTLASVELRDEVLEALVACGLSDTKTSCSLAISTRLYQARGKGSMTKPEYPPFLKLFCKLRLFEVLPVEAAALLGLLSSPLP